MESNTYSVEKISQIRKNDYGEHTLTTFSDKSCGQSIPLESLKEIILKLSRLQALKVGKSVGSHIRDEIVVEIDVSEALGSLKGLEVNLGDEVVSSEGSFMVYQDKPLTKDLERNDKDYPVRFRYRSLLFW